MRAVLSVRTWLLVALSITLVGVLYCAGFSQPFDREYLLDLYAHSQWNIPQSPRVMSDNELYQVAGLQLVAGADPFSINPEVPPLGKYMYGLAAEWFGTPYLVSSLMYIALIGTFYFLTKEFIDDQVTQLFAVLLLATSSVVFDQVSRTMLDLPQVLFLVIHVLCITRIMKQSAQIGDATFNAWGPLVGAGLSLGAFAACKIPFFVPVVVVADACLLLKKQWRNLVFVAGLGALLYVLTYSVYFIQGHSLIAWLKAQKWMVNFYAQGGADHIPFFNFITISSGWYKDWWGQSLWQWTTYWSPVWILGCIALVAVWINKAWRSYRYPAVMGLLFIVFQGVQPFWPRYYLQILPLTLICLLPFIKYMVTRWRFLTMGLILTSMAYGWLFYRLPPNDLVFHFTEDWNQGDYQDVYNYLYAPDFDRQTFWSNLKTVDSQLGILHRSATLTYHPVPFWQNQTVAVYHETITTEAGEVQIQQLVTLQRQGSNWKMLWNPQIVLPGYELGDVVQLTHEPLKSGTLFSRDGVVLSEGSTKEKVLLDLKQVGDIEPVVAALGEAFDMGGTELRTRLLVSSLPGQTVVVGELPAAVTTEERNHLVNQPGIRLVVVPSTQRIYGSKVIQAGKIDEIKQIEAQHPELQPVPQSTLRIHKQDGAEVTVLEQNGHAAKDVRLSQTAQQLFN